MADRSLRTIAACKNVVVQYKRHGARWPDRHHLLIYPGYQGGDLLIDLLDRGIRRVDLIQVEAQHEAMMIGYAAANHLAQLLGRSLDPLGPPAWPDWSYRRS
jgi:hypothetical protein